MSDVRTSGYSSLLPPPHYAERLVRAEQQIMTLQFVERAGLLPVFTAQNLRHRRLAVVVENAPRNSLEIGEGAYVSFQKRFPTTR